MKIFAKILFWILVSMAVWSCGDSVEMRKLRVADALMEDDPVSAQDSLERVNVGALDAEEGAYYALLYTQAQIKNWVVVDSDTLIRRAYDYYKGRDEGDRTIRAYFYKAAVSYNGKDRRGAMPDVLSAYEMAKDEGNAYWIAKSAELLRDIFYDVYNYPEAEKYSKEAIANYRLAGRVSFERYAIADLAATYLNERREDEVYTLLDSLYSECKKEERVDSAFLQYMLPIYIKSAVQTNRNTILEDSLFNKIYEEIPDSDSRVVDLMLNKSEYTSNDGEYEAADAILSNAMVFAKDEEDVARILYAKYETALKSGRYADAVKYTDTLITLQSRVAEDILYQSFMGSQRDFYNDKSVLSENRSKMLRIQLILAIVLAVVLIGSLWLMFRIKSHRKKAELEGVMASLQEMRDRANVITEEKHSLSEKIKNEASLNTELKAKLDMLLDSSTEREELMETLFKNQWKTLNMLCKEYNENGDSDKGQKILFRNIEKELDKLRSKENINKIRTEVDKYYNNILTQLEEECEFLKEDDITFISLALAGMSARSIGFFMRMKHTLVYQKKKRLAQKISESKTVRKEEILRLLD